MQRFTINADKFDETDINKEELKHLIDKHKTYVERITKNIDYYEAKHEILKRQKKISSASNVQTVCNHAKDVVDTAKGYFMSTPISFSTYDEKDKESIQKLIEAFDMADIDDIDSDNAHDMGVAGVAYEYVYVKSGTTEVTSKNLEPDHTFLVYDDTIEQNLLFGVYYFKFKDAISENECYRATVCTKNLVHQFILECSQQGTHKEVREAYEHFLGNVPIIEFLNNKIGIGDFEQQISLIDAYNTLMSDRVNDKVQFVESLLVIYGALMGDDNEELSEAIKILKENGLLELPETARAEYISRTFDEAGMESLRNAIKEDIYTFSHVPNLTDENFVGNSSGVAMEYKLFGLQTMTNEKIKYYKKGLKRRIELYCNYLNLKAISINPNLIKITFSTKLPKNLTELAQMIANLKGSVSQETLISQLDFVEDPKSEIDKVKLENKEALKQQQALFKTERDKPFSDENEVDEGDGEDEEPDDKTKG